MNIIDITLPISEDLPVWPGDPDIDINWLERIEKGGEVNISTLSIGAHTGTHLDMPLHFIQDGVGLDSLDLARLIGEVTVCEVPGNLDVIDRAFLETLEAIPKRLLFKTSNSRLWRQGVKEFREDYIALDAGAARYLVDMGCDLVGIDYLSIAAFTDTREPHLRLLEAGIVVLEGLDLSKVKPGKYGLVCLPIRLAGREGAPARAILIENISCA